MAELFRISPSETNRWGTKPLSLLGYVGGDKGVRVETSRLSPKMY